MDRRQRTFLIVVASIVVLFALVLLVLSLTRQQAIPAPVTPVVPGPTQSVPAPGTGTPVSPTGAATTPFPTFTPLPGIIPPTGTPSQATPVPSLSHTATPTMTASPGPTLSAEHAFFVSPDGKPENDGSQAHPWSLQYAFDPHNAAQPGDTIWVMGGKYMGPFTCSLKGAEGKPITVRAVPGQRAIIESPDLGIDIANAAYVNLWGLEITATENPRDPFHRHQSAYGVRINQGKPSNHIKFINLIVHDMPAQGFGWWQANTDSEIYGTLIFYNGVSQFDHGIYVHNTDGTKKIIDDIIFDNASHGIHAYGETPGQYLNNLYIEGNTLFDNGSIGRSTKTGNLIGFKRNILVGGFLVATDPVIINNYTFYPGQSGEALNLGYQAGSTGAVVEDNYFAGGKVQLGGDNLDITMMKNTILGIGLASLTELPFKQNNVLISSPSGDKIFVRPNKYEAGRANVTIYNWSRKPTATLSSDQLAGVQIKKGDHYELRNVQDYFNDVVSGVYDGQAIAVPMTGHTVAQPLGLNFRPPSTFPEFGSFVLTVTPANP